MKAFANLNATDFPQAAKLVADARRRGQHVVIAGGGSDVVGMIKDRLVEPDVVVNLKTIGGTNDVVSDANGVTIGGLITLDALARHPLVRSRYSALAEAGSSVATPQIRNVATLAGNVCQRPWCWYFRNGYECFKRGGGVCYAAAGENQFNAIFGGGPSYIVHPSDIAPALVAFESSFRIVGPSGDRRVAAADFFTLPRVEPDRENVLAPEELLATVHLPPQGTGVRSTYRKVFDRETWTHAVVSAAVLLELDEGVCRRARIVLGGVAPIPWRVQAAERLLAGRRITQALAEKAGEAAVAGAHPLAKNGYKIPLTRALVQRTLVELSAEAVPGRGHE